MVTRTTLARPFRALFLLALLIFAPTPQSISGQTSVAAPAPAGHMPTLLTSSAAGVRFALAPGLPAIQTDQSAGPGYQAVALEGFLAQEIAGQPALPQLGLSIALPPGAVPVARLVESQPTTLAVTRLAPAAERTLISYDADDPASAPEFAESYREDERLYQQNAFFPADIVALGQEGTLRDQRFVTVLIRPVQYNPVQGELLAHTQLVIEVEFLYPDGQPAPIAARPESPTFERLMAGTFINYAAAGQWRQPTVSIPHSPQVSPCMDDNAFRITVTETGIHQLTYAELVAAGFPNNGTIPDSKLRLCHMADEIDIRIDNQNGTPTFGGNDAILFYGEKLQTQETDKNIYWLTYSTTGQNGQRMSNASAAPGGATASSRYRYTQRLESDIEYLSTFPMTDENDHWYWNYIYHGDASGLNTHLDAPFTISDKATGSYTVPISINVAGHNLIKKHVFSVALNGAPLGTVNFTDSGRNQTYTFDFVADASQLLNGGNLITVTALDNGIAGQEHIVWINWIDVAPSRQYVAANGRLVWEQPTSGNWSYAISGLNGSAFALDVTDPAAPKVVPGLSGSSTVSFAQQISNPARYAISTTTGRLSAAAITRDTLPPVPLQASTNHADYIYISDPSLYLALDNLVSYRQSEGYTVFVASVQDIFDAFSYGLYDTAAIQRFLAYAYNSWDAGFAAPSYVTLVGESSYDHRDIQGLNGADGNLMPTYLKSGVDNLIGETAADNEYANFDADLLPEMHIGRLPARNNAELTIMVNRIINYETMPVQPLWMDSHLFVADNAHEEETGCELDPAGDFFLTVNNFLAQVFPLGRQQFTRLFYAPTACYPNQAYPVYEPYYIPTVTQMQLSIAAELAEGHAFVIYTGHSGSTFWGKDGTGFLNASIVQNNINNGDRTPILLEMTCLTGSYHRPEANFRNSLDEELLKLANGGIVAAYSPTGLQVQKGHDYLLHGFYDGIYDNGYMSLAEAVYAAKLFLFENTVLYQDLHDTFMLLGDPATDIRIWEATSNVYLPTMLRP